MPAWTTRTAPLGQHHSECYFWAALWLGRVQIFQTVKASLLGPTQQWEDKAEMAQAAPQRKEPTHEARPGSRQAWKEPRMPCWGGAGKGRKVPALLPASHTKL